MDIAAALRAAITTSGLSQRELSKRSGVAQPRISLFLSGDGMSIENLSRLAAALGFSFKLIKSNAQQNKKTTRTDRS